MADSLPRTLPASWYCSRPLLQLERRAVFLKAWYLLGPVIKFELGVPIDYEFAGIEITATRQNDDDIVVITSNDGQPVRTHTTSTGLLFTTISQQAPPFEEFFPGLEKTLSKVDFRARPHRRSTKYGGHFNWKAMVDGYQECLHCQYTHPSFSELYPPTSYAVVNHHNWCQHFADPKKPDDGLFLYFFPVCTLNVYGGSVSSRYLLSLRPTT